MKWKLEKAQDYVRFRVFDKHHIVNTGLEPGWWDTDAKILHANFALLNKFVEDECHYMNLCSLERANRKKLPLVDRLYFILPSPLDRLFRRRNRQSGLAFIDWHITHEYSDEDRSNMGFKTEEEYQQYLEGYRKPWREIRELYLWWNDIRPNRGDPLDLSGFSKHCDDMREKYGETHFFEPTPETDSNGKKFYEIKTRENKEEKDSGHKKALLSHEIEQQQNDEDDDMLIRLVKVRHCLWT